MEEKPYSAKKSIIIALVVYFIDALYLDQGVIAALFVFVIILFWLPKVLYKLIKKKNYSQEIKKISIYGSMAILVFVSIAINNNIAQKRANALIVTIGTFYQDTGQYPENLEALVPEYLPMVPKSKYTFAFNEFRYINRDGNVSLFYTDLPPFGRPTYDFDKKQWFYID